MDTNRGKYFSRPWFRGGLIGLFAPLIVAGLFILVAGVFNGLNIGLAENPLAMILSTPLILALVLIELPIVLIGRSLGLPIETGGAAFMLFELNVFGYILVIIFWSIVGALIGLMLEKKKAN